MNASAASTTRSALLEAAASTKRKYEVRNLAHLALVSSDMARTVEFYTEVLHFPLTKTLSLEGVGQHFFFEYAPQQVIAYFWFENAPQRIVNVSQPQFRLPRRGGRLCAFARWRLGARHDAPCRLPCVRGRVDAYPR